MKLKVLVVDHDCGARHAYMAVARSMGCAVEAFDESGGDLVGIVNQHHCDAVIIGCSPDSGLAPLRCLRRARIDLPVILISAHSLDQDEAKRLGAEAILSKPPDVAELKSALAALEPVSARHSDFATLLGFLERCRGLERPEGVDVDRRPGSLSHEGPS